jgi:hypothetical protein
MSDAEVKRAGLKHTTPASLVYEAYDAGGEQVVERGVSNDGN